MAAPPVTVVVTAMADSPDLRACLNEVCKQAHALEGEVLLAMNASPDSLTDKARAELASLCDQLVYETRIGKSHALNGAISTSRGQVIAFTDDDARPEPGWLAALTAPLLEPNRDPALVGCGGPVMPIYPANTPNWFKPLLERDGNTNHFLTPIHWLGTRHTDYAKDTPIGANCAYRREVFINYHYDTRLGPNRQTGLRGGEDTLLATQLLRDGYRLHYCPDARVYHPVHSERMTEACLRKSYYAMGIQANRKHRILYGKPKKKTTAKLLKRIAVMRLRLMAFHVLPPWAYNKAEHLHYLGKYEFYRGLLAELRNPYQAEIRKGLS
jgi:cellulose synthase/poly-beta-1,6-N-acetylglucosamine synthase-like glycosyltransferase